MAAVVVENNSLPACEEEEQDLCLRMVLMREAMN